LGSSLADCTPPSQGHDQSNKGQQGESPDAHIAKHGPNQGEVAAKDVAGCPDQRRPGQPTDRAEDLEPPERHAGHTGEHRAPRAQSKDEPSDQHRLVAVAREENLRVRDVFGPDVEEVAETLHEWTPTAVSEVVASVRACCCAHESKEDHDQQRVVSRRSPSARDQQQSFAWKGNAGALDQDA
jgi:hypothetical protein